MKGLEVIQTYLTEEEQVLWHSNIRMQNDEGIVRSVINTECGNNNSSMISGYFHWDNTPEGYRYWDEVWCRVYNGTLPPQEEKEVFIMTKHKFV